MCIAISHPHLTLTLTYTKRILRRQNGVVDLSLLLIILTDLNFALLFSLFTTIYIKFLHLDSFYFTYRCILLCKYYLELLNLINLII